MFKDGRLIGEVWSMYKNSDTIPWRQDLTSKAIFTDMDMVILNQMQSRFGFTSIVEIGCGLGYVTERIRQEVRNP